MRINEVAFKSIGCSLPLAMSKKAIRLSEPEHEKSAYYNRLADRMHDRTIMGKTYDLQAEDIIVAWFVANRFESLQRNDRRLAAGLRSQPNAIKNFDCAIRWSARFILREEVSDWQSLQDKSCTPNLA